MKKILYICSCVTVGMLFAYSCVKDPTSDVQTSSQDAFLSVEEAQAFFEESFASGTATRSESEDESPRFLSPGEYTPQWSSAATSQNDALGSVDVPLLTEYKYRAIRSEFKNGKARAYTVEITQKMVVVKSKTTQQKSHYLLTLIPDKGSDTRDFTNSGDNGGYSGYALYTSDGFPVRLNKYHLGEKVAGVSIIGIKDKEKLSKCIRVMINVLSKIKIGKYATLTTRSGEDEFDYGSADSDWYAHFGDIFIDDDGNIFVDNSGDGNPDSVWIPTIDVVTDPDPVPDTNPNFESDVEVDDSSYEDYIENWDKMTEEELEDYFEEVGWIDDTKTTEPTIKKTVNLVNSTKFRGYNSNGIKNCHTLCVETMKAHGLTSFGSPDNVFKLMHEVGTGNNRELVKYGNDVATNYENAIKCIDRHLDGDPPRVIMVGVNHTVGKGINEGATDHFVVINGRGYNSTTKQYYYTYYEVATGTANGHNNEENRLIYDPDNNRLYDSSAGAGKIKKTYDVTQVRPNDGETKGTISQ